MSTTSENYEEAMASYTAHQLEEAMQKARQKRASSNASSTSQPASTAAELDTNAPQLRNMTNVKGRQAHDDSLSSPTSSSKLGEVMDGSRRREGGGEVQGLRRDSGHHD